MKKKGGRFSNYRVVFFLLDAKRYLYIYCTIYVIINFVRARCIYIYAILIFVSFIRETWKPRGKKEEGGGIDLRTNIFHVHSYN